MHAYTPIRTAASWSKCTAAQLAYNRRGLGHLAAARRGTSCEARGQGTHWWSSQALVCNPDTTSAAVWKEGGTNVEKNDESGLERSTLNERPMSVQFECLAHEDSLAPPQPSSLPFTASVCLASSVASFTSSKITAQQLRVVFSPMPV